MQSSGNETSLSIGKTDIDGVLEFQVSSWKEHFGKLYHFLSLFAKNQFAVVPINEIIKHFDNFRKVFSSCKS
jgi:hypothetical protein